MLRRGSLERARVPEASQGLGLIRSTRRQIVILNRRGLIEEAHGPTALPRRNIGG
ncbi:hypothetical protein TAL182_PE00068 (plasmid) [Rhizobium sp. TAL182]|nr:hypothetical protein TAL182_PE00068 [Rhizobium sp. TAL182]